MVKLYDRIFSECRSQTSPFVKLFPLLATKKRGFLNVFRSKSRCFGDLIGTRSLRHLFILKGFRQFVPKPSHKSCSDFREIFHVGGSLFCPRLGSRILPAFYPGLNGARPKRRRCSDLCLLRRRSAASERRPGVPYKS